MGTLYNLPLLSKEGVSEGLSERLRLISRYSINHPLKNPSLYVKLFEYLVENCWIGPITRQGFICITTLLTLRLIILHICTFIFSLEVAWTSARFHGRSLRFWRCTLGKKGWTSEGGMLLQNCFFFFNLGAQKYHFLQFPQDIFSLNKYEGKCIN